MKPCLLAMALIAVSASGSAAGVPDPVNSTVDPCLVVCPAGDVVTHVMVRDLNNAPVINSGVVIDFCGCPNVALCPQSVTDPYQRLTACSIRKFTDAQGRADFAIRAGGVCSNQGVRIFADGVFIGQRNVASPDQNGNLMVGLGDPELATAKRGSSDPTADFDCDHLVTDADIAFVYSHAKHQCPPPDPTPAVRSTWGALKTIYR